MASLENTSLDTHHSFSKPKIVQPLLVQIYLVQQEFEKILAQGGLLTAQEVNDRFDLIFNSLESIPISSEVLAVDDKPPTTGYIVKKGDVLKLGFYGWVVLKDTLVSSRYGDQILYTGYCYCFRADLDCHIPRMVNFTINDVEQIKKGVSNH